MKIARLKNGIRQVDGIVSIPSEVVDWLCQRDNPPVRYLTMKNILMMPEENLVEERSKLNSYPAIQGILRKRDIFWKSDTRLYRKYKGGYWQIIFLGDLNADGGEPAIRDGCEYILNDQTWQEALAKESTGWACLMANISRGLANLGYNLDIRVKGIIENIGRSIIRHEGIDCRDVEFSLVPKCHLALPKVLMALAKYPEANPIIERAKDICVRQLLDKRVYFYVPKLQKEWIDYKKSRERKIRRASLQSETRSAIAEALLKEREKFRRPGEDNNPKDIWLRFGFPLDYNSDVLEAMRSLLEANIEYDPRMDDAINAIRGKMKPDGRWNLEFSLNNKMWVEIEEKGKPSKWITYYALLILLKYDQRVRVACS
ncbi:MAG: hypothetical protein A2W25_08130 [candidate division Zixibacteria bacterium RBG_16_53_22]|nr:MAG: hypothetical protein A2W25_08130 [candidate division Zixibacteria bacterium RBG_16_53_22]